MSDQDHWLHLLFASAADGQQLTSGGEYEYPYDDYSGRDRRVLVDRLSVAIRDCAALMTGGEVKYSVTGAEPVRHLKVARIQYLLDKHCNPWHRSQDDFPVECLLRMWHVEQMKFAGIQIYVINPINDAQRLTVELMGPGHEAIIGNCLPAARTAQHLPPGQLRVGLFYAGVQSGERRDADNDSFVEYIIPAHPNRWRDAEAIYGGLMGSESYSFPIHGEPAYIANETLLAYLEELDRQDARIGMR